MKAIVLRLGMVGIVVLAAIGAEAQTTCPVDPVTGNAVAQMISPANGSTLPAGAVTFEWCNANADYFLSIESVPGAHDIFFAFAGGPGAGVESLTLGPACAATPPIGCIPANGETIHVTLWTLKHGQVLPPSPFQYTFTAAGPSTTTTTQVTTTTSSTTTTTLPPLCAATPATACRLAAPGASLLQIKKDATDVRDQFKWKWARGDQTVPSAFGDPVNGSAAYRVCLYDASADQQPRMQMDVPPGGTCGTAPCWRASTTGFSYANRAGTPDGLARLKLKAGAAGKASVQMTGTGVNLPTPALPLSLPVTVQLVIGDGATTECWQTTYTTATRNDTVQFSGKGP